jgi:pilus assembly protein CpaB
MANINQKTALALSVVFGLATAALVYYKTQPSNAGANTPLETKVGVLVAREMISPRTTIQPEMLVVRMYARDEEPPEAVREMTLATGKIALQQIPAGAPLTQRMIGDRGPGLGLSFGVKPFQRAVTVPIDPVSGVAGYLKPGDRVDVLATYSGSENNTARVVLQDVELLAIGNQPASTTDVKDKPNTPADAVTATLAGSADQMQLLALTAAKAKIQLALRSPDDHAYVPPTRVTTTEVFGGNTQRTPAPPPAAVAAPVQMRPLAVETSAPVRSAKPAPAQKTVTVTRGTDTQTVPVQ